MAEPAPLLAVLTGPSAAGKDSVRARFKSRPGYCVVATTTTRLPRVGEVSGDDLNFVSEGEFSRMLKSGELLEHATVYGYLYGVPKTEVRRALAAGNDVILRTDVQGARYIKSVIPAAIAIFIAPPSIKELERRLRLRGGDSPEQVELRLQEARNEIEGARQFDYTVVNDDLDRCVAEVVEILERERNRRGRPAPVVE